MTDQPRCPAKGCPVRWRTPGSPDRYCVDHEDGGHVGVHGRYAQLQARYEQMMRTPADPGVRLDDLLEAASNRADLQKCESMTPQSSSARTMGPPQSFSLSETREVGCES